MPALFVFLFKVNIALLVFCAGYYFVLRHLTFYTLNRVYLITAIIFASVYPKIDLTSFFEKHETIAVPVQNVVLIWQKPVAKLSKPDYWQWASIIFWAGAALLAARLAVQLVSLFKLYRRSSPAHILGHDVRVIEGKAAPFSFWRSIYVNPENHNPADLRSILLHEQVHVNGWHTIDILLAELSSIFYWFNPGIWLMKKAVRENIEFITDRKILNKGIEAKAYQYSLVNVSFNATTPGIVNHFNISTIKKRIIMMNAKRSSKVNLTRYAFVVPAVALLLVFSFSKAEVTKPIKLQLAHAISPVTKVISDAAANVIKKADTAVKLTLLPTAVKQTNLELKKITILATKGDSNYNTITIKADTGKKDRLMLRGTATRIVTNGDSANYVVNGKKMDPANFKTINPDDIMAINVVSAQSARELLMPADNLFFNNDQSIIFVTTKNSEAGKALMQRLGNRRQITNLRITKDGVPQNVKGEDITILARPSTVGATATFSTLGPDSAKDIQRLKLYRSDGPADVVVIGHPSKLAGGQSSSVSGLYKGTGTMQSTTFSIGEGKSSSVNRISDKLILIDGKVASEKDVKKLSAFDIDRMNVSNSADTVKKYGEKARYGVVFIYTKKGK